MISKILPAYDSIRNNFFELGKQLVSETEMLQRDASAAFPKEAWLKAGEEVLQGLPVAQEYGGKGFSCLETCAAFEGLGKGSLDNGLNFSIGAHLLACVVPIHLYGSSEQKKKYLAQLSCGKWIAANAMTEHHSGSDAFAMQAEAKLTATGYLLNGEKKYITSAPIADVLVVYALTDKAKGFFGGVSAFVVPATAPGLQVSAVQQKMGLRTAQMAHVVFKNVELSADQMIGELGAGGAIFNQSMIWERIVLAAMHIGQLERVFETTLAFCQNRTVNEKRITQFENVAHVLADTKVMIAAGRNLVYDAALAVDEKKRSALVKSSEAKLFVADKGVEQVKKLQLLYGAAGYLTQNQVEREYRDLYASLIYSGTTDIQRNIIVGML